MSPTSGGDEKFARNESIVKKLTHWHVVVRGKQATLGAVTFVLTRTVDSLGDVTSEEMAEFPQAVRWFEGAVRALYGPDRIDYAVMLTNDPHVHLDAFPRYARPVEAAGGRWTDEDWPGPVSSRAVETLSRARHHQICADYATQA